MSIIPTICYNYLQQQRLVRMHEEDVRRTRQRAIEEEERKRRSEEKLRALHERGDEQ